MKKYFLLLYILWVSPLFAQNLVTVEYYIDSDSVSGNVTQVSITPSPDVDMNINVNLNNITDGVHVLYIRTIDEYGTRSLTYSTPFVKEEYPPGIPPPNIVKMEYYIDDDPGFGLGISIPITADSVIDKNFIANLSGTADGFHILSVRAFDDHGKWSRSYSTPFVKEEYPPGIPPPNIVKMEYYIDDDPGFGLGISIPITVDSVIEKNFIANLSGTTDGFHIFSVRAMDDHGKWSRSYSTPFVKEPGDSVNIKSIEYFFTKTGFTSTKYVYSTFTPAGQIDVDFTASLADMAPDSTYQMHTIVINEEGYRSLEYLHNLNVLRSTAADSARFTISPQSGTVDTTFTFNAATSIGSGLTYRWDFNNDGTWDTDYLTTAITTYKYTLPGTYTVKLEVKNGNGLTDSTMQSITVSDRGTSQYHFRVAYNTTGNNATVLIQTASAITLNNNPFTLSTGDEIAIYTPLPDTICCGVGIWNGSNMAITVWGDNDQTTSIREGFRAGENYTFRLWDVSESKEYSNAEATFSSGTSTYSANAMSIVSALNFTLYIQLQIFLPSGWSMISSNVIPQSPRMDSLFQNIVSKVVIVKNGAGKVYWPRYTINQIGGWNALEGYLIYMSASDTLKIRGQRANPSTPIPLPAGWSMITYLPTATMSPVRACSTISDKVVIMKDVSGKVYWPRYSINQIGTMQAGKGYQIYLSGAGTLVYPAASTSKEGYNLAEGTNREQLSPQHFSHIRGTGSNATILMRMNEKPVINGTALEVGDEIGVFTPEGICAGAGVWNEDDIVITVWGDNAETMNIDGFTDGQAYIFRLWNKSAAVEKDISPLTESGNLTYSENGITVISYEKSSALPENFILRQNYPNPFNPSTRIEYQIKKQSDVTLAIYNTAGQLIRILVQNSQPAGIYSMEWDGRNASGIQVPSGIYLYRLQAGQIVETRKMVMMK